MPAMAMIYCRKPKVPYPASSSRTKFSDILFLFHRSCIFVFLFEAVSFSCWKKRYLLQSYLFTNDTWSTNTSRIRKTKEKKPKSWRKLAINPIPINVLSSKDTSTISSTLIEPPLHRIKRIAAMRRIRKFHRHQSKRIRIKNWSHLNNLSLKTTIAISSHKSLYPRV